MLRAFRIRNATRNSRISCDVAALWVRSNARRDKVFSSSVLTEESLPILVEASEVGVDDIGPESYSKLHALLPCGTRTGSGRLARRSFPKDEGGGKDLTAPNGKPRFSTLHVHEP